MQVSKTQASEVFDAVKRVDFGFGFRAGGVDYFLRRPFNGAHDNEFEIHFRSPKGAEIEVSLIIAEPAIINTYVERIKAGLQVRDTDQIEPPALRIVAVKAIRACLRECHAMTVKREKAAVSAEKAKLREIAHKI